jgi:hypothetical protein
MAKKIKVENKEISIQIVNDSEYISLTDMVRGNEGSDHIRNWLRNRNTVEFIGLWETIHNPDFKGVEFDTFRKEAGLNSFNLTPRKWVESTDAIGIYSKSGRYGGTYAHKDIAFEFGSWISPLFKLMLLKEFQRLKEEESNRYNLEWNIKRLLTKANYEIHTDAIKEHIIPKSKLSEQTQWIVYAEEADILNVALFGCTAKEWRDVNEDHSQKGLNLRDFASINELVVLSNLENINALLIEKSVVKDRRFKELARVALKQLKLLNANNAIKSIKRDDDQTYINAEKKEK